MVLVLHGQRTCARWHATRHRCSQAAGHTGETLFSSTVVWWGRPSLRSNRSVTAPRPCGPYHRPCTRPPTRRNRMDDEVDNDAIENLAMKELLRR